MNTKLYHIVTYGCQMNVHESEKIAGQLYALSYTATDNIELADIIIFNTCCIRESAETKEIGNIGAVKTIKKSRPNVIVAVVGCMTQQKGFAENLIKKFPFINIVLGTHNINKLSNSILSVLNDRKRINEIIDSCDYTDKNVPIIRDRTLNAWVNIMYGCNNFCTYCIVPYVRGREVSRLTEEILQDVKELVQQKNYKIITLLGQNVNSYSSSLNGEKVDFAKLLRLINNIEGEFRIKFMTSHPKDLSNELISAIKECKKVSKYLHLPVQSGSTQVLKRMNRRYTREHYLNLIEKLRTKIPDIALSTDIIVGFPGETEKDFEDTCDLIQKVRYNGAFVFMFSKRSGTVAETMPNQIELAVKRERIHRLLEIQKQINNKMADEEIGKKFEVLIEEVTEKEAIASTSFGKVVRIKDANLRVGSIVDIIVTNVKGSKLIGEVYLGE
ncbi:MAG: tRNA (N6-isopentenyl adenosine(37)-C2)-methylthiotransferase MiaB [Clostridia bacterium]|nr:tRNA (N6-isopentenyl adenosine(37)-C2)-methylthiotransferase MiaB [Clostridia bacterium]MDD4275756.1 tRNA (N6-isopentenyl adenosine(37)-C2)-methylthiotransferase MiaB [Clostridia bacterium]